MPWRETRSGTPLRHMSAYVGGLGSGMYEDLMGFLDQSHYDVALIQETKLKADSEYTTPQWICVGSGSIVKHAGVMILIRRTLTNATEVRHDAIMPGRLLRVRFPLGASNRMISVVCTYQHERAPKDAHILDKRTSGRSQSRCIAAVPQREMMVVGGDLNAQLMPLHPHVGHGTGALSSERAPDAESVHTLLTTHSLVALNS